MFFLRDPFYYSPLDDFFENEYAPRRQAEAQQRHEYGNAIENRLNQVLREEFGIDPYHNVDIRKRVHQLGTLQRHDRNDHSAFKQRVIDENNNYYNEPPHCSFCPPPPPPPQYRYQPPQQQRGPFSSMYYTSSSSYDGNNLVEEHREKVTDADGVVHQTTRRRLGDRWYQVDSTTDKEGKTSSKETWHNVPEDQVENFKEEWGQQQQNSKLALEDKSQQ